MTMARALTIAAAIGTALALAACDQGAKTPQNADTTPAAETPPATTAPVAAAPTVPTCATLVERTIPFTSPQAKDKMQIEALGPDCANPAMFARIWDANGRLVYANMMSGKWLMSVESFPPGGGAAQGVAENLYDIGEPNSKNLPEWKAGSPAVSTGGYGAYEALVPQPAYERLRALNGTTLIKRGGGESGTIYIYDPESAEAVAIARFAV